MAQAHPDLRKKRSGPDHRKSNWRREEMPRHPDKTLNEWGKKGGKGKSVGKRKGAGFQGVQGKNWVQGGARLKERNGHERAVSSGKKIGKGGERLVYQLIVEAIVDGGKGFMRA